MLTQAPPNTGAGWYTLATGAWPGVHGSTNNTFHINGQPFANRTAAFDPERPAGRVDRPVRRARRPQGRPGRVGRRANATINGPTIDFQQFFSGRGVATNFIGAAGEPLFDDAPFIAAFGLQFDHPAGYAGPGARSPARRRRRPPAGPASAATYSPAKEMRLRVLDCGTDKYGLNA